MARTAPWQGTAFDTVFIGGGTPTLLPADGLAALLAACREALPVLPGAEITTEANPGTVDGAGLAILRAAGIERLSLGVQSLNDDELRLLGRIHTADEAREALAAARAAGIRNVNLDLIFGLPGQTLADWRATLDGALDLAPEHLSLYALTVEEGTPLEAAIAAGTLPPPDDDLAADMYEYAEATLTADYAHYEISNWARRLPGEAGHDPPALACRHNLKYWRNARYLGLGAAAYSYDGHVRAANVDDPAAYIARIAAGESARVSAETTDRPREMGETMMLGLRLSQGVSWAGVRGSLRRGPTDRLWRHRGRIGRRRPAAGGRPGYSADTAGPAAGESGVRRVPALIVGPHTKKKSPARGIPRTGLLLS